VDLPPLSGRVVELLTKDADDGPTGQIIELLRPPVVFCDDRKHLGSFEILADEWFSAALAVYATSKREGVMVSIQMGGAFVIQGSTLVLQASFEGLARIDRKILRDGILLLAFLLVVALAIPTSRHWLHEQTRSSVKMLKDVVAGAREGVEDLAEKVAQMELRAHEGGLALQTQQRTVAPPRTVLAHLGRDRELHA
jgi:hypothetical protein